MIASPASLVRCLLGLLLIVNPAACAQTPRPPLESLLDHLVANAELYRTTLPSLTADETVDSTISYLKLFRNHADAKGTFRVIRNPATGVLVESRQITMLDGKPVPPDKKVTLPATLFGGFGHFQEMFFTPHNRLCYRFEMLPKPGVGGSIEIAITSPAPADLPPGCDPARHGLTGLIRVDPLSQQVIHLERTVPDADTVKTSLAPFASVDSAPTLVGDQTYWLPTVVTGRILNGKLKGKFIAHYSNYHRYSASMTLLPGATEVFTPDHPAPTPPKP